MYHLTIPIAELYALTGQTLVLDLIKAHEGLEIPTHLKERQKKRIDMVHKGERLDFIPIKADIRWWLIEKYHDGTLQEALADCDTEKIVMCSYGVFGPGESEPVPGVTSDAVWEGPPVKYVNSGYPGNKRTVRVTTSAGTITASERYASRSFAVTEYPVKTIDDLRVVKDIYEKRAAHASQIPVGGAPQTPIQNMLLILAGVENTVFLLEDYREEVENFMDFLDEIQMPVIEHIAQNNKSVGFCENYSADIIYGYFDRYLKPQLLKRKQIANKYGATLGVHHDGKLQPLLGKLWELGVGYANGITSAPSGDVDMKDLRAIAGEHMVLHDIIPQCVFMDEFDIGAFKEYIWQAVDIFKNDNRVIFGIGDMLPCTADIKRLEIMIDIIMKATYAPSGG